MIKRFLGVCTALLLLHGMVAQAQAPVRLLVNISPPYADPKLPQQGLAVELLSHIFQRAGYTPEITFESWTRAMEGVDIGLYDALGAAWYTEERAEKFLYSKPYLESKLILLKLRADTTPYRELKHLAGKRIGIRGGYAYGVDFAAIPGLRISEENHVIQNLLKLLNGSVDLVIGDHRTLALQMHEFLGKEIHKFQVVEIPLPRRARHVAASKAIPGEDKMVAAFNSALQATLKDGSHAEIVARWDALYAIPGSN
jgi:polar amino acid transport system substrate-binding protein